MFIENNANAQDPYYWGPERLLRSSSGGNS